MRLTRGLTPARAQASVIARTYEVGRRRHSRMLVDRGARSCSIQKPQRWHKSRQRLSSSDWVEPLAAASNNSTPKRCPRSWCRKRCLQHRRPVTSRATTFTLPIRSSAKVRSTCCSFRVWFRTSKRLGGRPITAHSSGASPRSAASSFSTSAPPACPTAARRSSPSSSACMTYRQSSTRSAASGRRYSECPRVGRCRCSMPRPRTSALVLYGSYAKRSWAPDYPFGWKDDQWEQVFDNFERHWGTPQNIAVTMYTPSLAGDPEGCARRAAYLRASASPGAAISIMKMNREIDVRHVLPAIRVPTLILHRTAEQVIDVANARYMAQHIPGAKLIELAGVDHNYLTGDRDALLDEVEVFLTGARHVHEPERVLATVLFADIVGSTERAAALGDHSWRELLAAFCAKARAVLQQYRGREINTSGDGFLATFDGPARAIRCAGAICDAVRALGLDVRCGLHTGECELVGNDIAGIAVHIGARVAGLAAAGEVLVSQTARDLVAGSGLAFEERGTHTLKGVPNAWHLFRAIPS